MRDNKCLIIKRHKFLWWEWEEEIINHDWAYKNKEERVCLKCKKRELLIGRYYYNGSYIDDWKTKL